MTFNPFYDTLVRILQAEASGVVAQGQTTRSAQGDRVAAETLLTTLTAPTTQRVLFSADQAERFAALDTPVDFDIQQTLHWPFPTMWIEFTRGVRNVVDTLFPNTRIRGVLVEDGITPHFDFSSAQTISGSPMPPPGPLAGVGWFYTDGGEDDADWQNAGNACFTYGLSTGAFGCGAFNLLAETAPFSKGVTSTMLPEHKLDPKSYVFFGARGRTASSGVEGDVERNYRMLSKLLGWMVTYMVAKGIEVVPYEGFTRSMRRQEARRFSTPPAPWHIFDVSPTIKRSVVVAEGSHRKHSYRYDVMGHLRFGRHRRKDGSYSRSIEWVPPHQRGLANDTYIPATRRFGTKER